MFVSRLEAFLADNEHFDSEGIIGAGCYDLEVEDEPEEGLWAVQGLQPQADQEQLRGPWHLNGH